MRSRRAWLRVLEDVREAFLVFLGTGATTGNGFAVGANLFRGSLTNTKLTFRLSGFSLGTVDKALCSSLAIEGTIIIQALEVAVGVNTAGATSPGTLARAGRIILDTAKLARASVALEVTARICAARTAAIGALARTAAGIAVHFTRGARAFELTK